MARFMAVRNRVKDFVDGLGITRYEFAERTKIARNTAYYLYGDPTQIPTASVMDKIYKAYPDVQPNDLIVFLPDEEPSAA